MSKAKTSAKTSSKPAKDAAKNKATKSVLADIEKRIEKIEAEEASAAATAIATAAPAKQEKPAKSAQPMLTVDGCPVRLIAHDLAEAEEKSMRLADVPIVWVETLGDVESELDGPARRWCEGSKLPYRAAMGRNPGLAVIDDEKFVASGGEGPRYILVYRCKADGTATPKKTPEQKEADKQARATERAKAREAKLAEATKLAEAESAKREAEASALAQAMSKTDAGFETLKTLIRFGVIAADGSINMERVRPAGRNARTPRASSGPGRVANGFGMSTTALLRLLGACGLSKTQAVKFCEVNGIAAASNTIGIQVGKGARGIGTIPDRTPAIDAAIAAL